MRAVLKRAVVLTAKGCLLAFLSWKTPRVIHCWATVSPCIKQCYLPLPQLHSSFRDFYIGVCHVMKITITESNTDKVSWTGQMFRFWPHIPARASKLPIMTMAIVWLGLVARGWFTWIYELMKAKVSDIDLFSTSRQLCRSSQGKKG